jgi:hypothetical protein
VNDLFFTDVRFGYYVFASVMFFVEVSAFDTIKANCELAGRKILSMLDMNNTMDDLSGNQTDLVAHQLHKN